MTSSDITALIKKQPIGFGCGLLSLLLAGWIYYRSSLIEEKQTEYDAKAAEAGKIISNVGISKNLPEQVGEIQDFTKDLDGRLIKAGQLAINLQYFYKLEAENEVKLLDIRQSSPRKSSTTYTGIPYNVTVQGSFKQVMIFLNRLENGRHFCRISSAVFGKVQSGNSTATDMSLALNLELLGQP